MIIRTLSLFILISLFRLPFLATPTNDSALQKHRSALSVINVARLPAQILHASIESMIVSSWVELEVYNTLPETVRELHLRILKYSNGKLIETADGVVNNPIPVGSHRYRVLVQIALEPGTQASVLVTKVRTGTGVWFIQPDVLSNSVKMKLGPGQLNDAVTYEPNINPTANEKTEILATVFKQLARDPNQVEFVGNRRRLLVSRDDCSYATRLSAEVPVEVLSLDEIQAIANKEQRVVYIRCVEFDIEGARVGVHLVLNDRRSVVGNPIVVPFNYNFEFVLLKNGNKWIVEKSNGYS